jgi:outer membrane receptor protein involved in Fe transport
MQWKLVAPLVVFLCAPAFAQSGGVATISGVVHDPSGSVVPNASVVISSISLGQVRSISTNSAGVFTAPALVPTPGYSVVVKAAGFAQNETKDINLQVGQNLNLSITMTVAQSATQVEVSSAAEFIDDQKTDVSTAVGQQQIDNLPINGRRVDSFVLLTPGVTNDATFGLLSFRGVAGNNSFLVDGNDNTEQFYDENAGRTRIQSQISQDAVQEFQVVSDNYSAEFGRAMGGVVNTVTRSGTNDLHGTGFYYFRSTGFDARDPFSTFNPTEKRVEGGATITGPIIKNKLLFTLNFDLTYRLFPLVDSYVASGIIDPNSHTFLGCGAPATPAQCAAINNLLPRFFGQVPRTDYNDLGFGRLDYHLSDRNTFTGEFNILRWYSPNGIQTGLVSTSGAGINSNGDDSVRVRNGKFGWTFVPSSNFVLNFRVGYDTDKQQDDPDKAELGGGLGLLNVSVGGVQLGPATYVPRVEPNETRYEFSEDATWVKNNHTFKFGFSSFSSEDYVYYIASIADPNGAYTYNTTTAFAQDYSGGGSGKNWTTFAQQFGNPVADYKINEYALYAVDQWKVNSRLTLNYGVRWDKSKSLKFPVTNPDWPGTGRINTPNKNFSPRLGLTYRIDDKTVIRGGFGLFYARLLGGLVDNLYTTNGIYQIAQTLQASNATQLAAGPAFPNALSGPTTVANAAATTIQYADPNLKTPYSAQGNITLERQIGGSMVVSGSWLTSRGIHLLSAYDQNAPNPTQTYTYTITDVNLNPVSSFTTPIYTGSRPNTKYGSVYEVENGIDSLYEGLALTFEKRFSHGFQTLASYTWSHEIDDGQGGGSNAIFFNSLGQTYNGNNSFERGSGILDQRHRFVHSFVWAPVVHSSNAWEKYLLANWQLSGITTIATGHPTGSPTVRIVSAGPSGLLNNNLVGFGSTRVPFLPVDAIYTPASYRADVRLSKNIPFNVKDREVKLQLNFEVFNVSNSWSPTSVATQEYTATKGVLTPSPAAWGYGTADGGFPDGTQARRVQVNARIQF